ncbi:MAG TPA: glutamine amidotransferase [Steroidobacteraceae bacterium]|nr:glutamine amidotransferase [Steroidobacteraceae bacterium]
MTSQRLALAIRHVHFEDCGTLADALTERGYRIRYIDAGRDTLQEVDADTPDLLVGLGGPVGVYDVGAYPWIRQELAVLERRIRAGKPTIGICLGAQMLAHVLGARVFPGPVKELGFAPLILTEAGRSSVVEPLGHGAVSMLHWHGDTFDLPAGATLLASTREVAHQIYSWGDNVLAFQCHPEFRAADVESWLIGHACEIAGTPGVEPRQLRADAARHGPLLAERAHEVFSRWLDRL